MIAFEHPLLLVLAPLAPIGALSAWRAWRNGDLSRRRARLFAATLGGAVLLAVLAAAGPRPAVAVDEATGTRAVVVVDRSASLADEDRQAARALSRRAAVDAAVEGVVAVEGSDLASGLEAAAAILRARGAAGDRRVLLLSDGEQTAGDLAASAARLAAEGVSVDVAVAGRSRAPIVRAFDPPAVARIGETVRIDARLAARAGDGARGPRPIARVPVTLSVDGRTVARREIDLDGTVEFTWRGSRPGPHALRLAAGETVVERAIEIAPAPRAVVLEEAGGPGIVAESLAAAGLRTERLAVDRLPAGGPASGGPAAGTVEALDGVDLIALDGIDPEALPAGAVSVLGAFARRGGGLLAFPGAKGLAKGESRAAAGLRRILPFATVDDEKKEPPAVALVFILDRSDSMNRERKWEVAARTTASAYREMNPQSTVGLVTFSDFHEWVVPPTKVKEVPDFPSKVARIRLAGGTNLFPALEEAHRALAPLDARLKHVVLLSDGVSVSRLADHEALLRRIAASRITVSTVAMGSEADPTTMSEIAQRTGGRFWFVRDADELPRIFAEETRRSGREDLPAEPLPASVSKPVEALEGIDPTRPGWTGTTHARARATSETFWRIATPADGSRAGTSPPGPVRPLLGRTRIGEGFAVALAAPLADVPVDRVALARAMARLALPLPPGLPPVPGAAAVTAMSERRGDEDGVRIDVRATASTNRDGWTVQLVAGSAPARRTALLVTSRTRATAWLPLPDGSGPLLVRILDASGLPVGWASPPSRSEAEFAETGGIARLDAIAASSGGERLFAGEVPSWMGRGPRRTRRPWSVWLGSAALALATASTWLRRSPPEAEVIDLAARRSA